MAAKLKMIFIALIILSFLGAGTASATGVVSVVPQSQNAAPGAVFSVSVNIDPKDNQVKGVEINLKFDQNSVQLNSVVIGSFLGGSPLQFLNSIDNTNGMLKLSHTVNPGNPAVTSPGTYATLNFQVKNSALPGTSTLGLTRAILSDDTGANIPGVMTNNGSIAIVSTSGVASSSTSTSNPTSTVAGEIKNTPGETKNTATPAYPKNTISEPASAPKTPGFGAHMALIAFLTGLIICNLIRKRNRFAK